MQLKTSCILVELDYTISTIKKITESFLRNPVPSDFTWGDFSKMMRHFGYKETTKGGSRRKFYNEKTKHMLSIDEPHGGDAFRKFDLRRVRRNLKEQGLFNDE